MSLPRYPKYKESGVEWLGEVPGHWEVTALKRGFNVTLGKMLQPESNGVDDELLPYLRAANIQWDGVETSDIKQMWLSKRDRAHLRLANGDLLVSEGGDVGRSCLWAGELESCYFQNSVNRVRAIGENSNRYLYYWLSTIKDKGYVDVLCNKSTIAHFTAEKVAAVPVPFPTAVEQTQIAVFLDRETAKIDELVAEQRRLMALLKEKRQAVISHAVTRGLNPDAPLKPSGIEWLGDVPEHWEVLPAKRVSNVFVPQRNKPDLNADGDGHFWVTMEQMRNEEIKSAELYVTESAARDAGTRVLKAGAVVASCVGTFGLAAINSVDVIINQQLQAFIPTDRVDAKFMRHCVVIAESYFEQIGTAATIAYVNQLGFANMPLVLPPKAEQHQVVEFLAAESTRFDALTTEAQRAITLLQERRTALISAAVTGQIDVRGVVAA